MYIAVGFAILFFVGTSWKQLTALVVLFVLAIVVVLVVAPATGHHVLKPYQMQRLTGFLHPSHDPRNQTYNITAVADRDRVGREDRPGHGGRHAGEPGLPARHHTDFIFAVVGETYGFVGAAIVLSLYALLIWRALRILTMAKNLYGTLIAGGLARDADVPGIHQRGHDDRHHADHRSPAAPHELRRLIGARNVYRHRPSTVDLYTGTDDSRIEESRTRVPMTAAPQTRARNVFARRIELSKLALPPRTYPNFHKGLNEL